MFPAIPTPVSGENNANSLKTQEIGQIARSIEEFKTWGTAEFAQIVIDAATSEDLISIVRLHIDDLRELLTRGLFRHLPTVDAEALRFLHAHSLSRLEQQYRRDRASPAVVMLFRFSVKWRRGVSR